MRCVRPDFTIPSHARAFSSNVPARAAIASIAAGARSSAASRSAVGTTSFVDCAMLTSSLADTSGWPRRAAHELGRAVGEHLVHVHVVRRPGARLVDVHHEVLAVLAREHLARGRLDGAGLLAREEPEPRVHPRGGELHTHGRVDERGVGAEAGDGEVHDRARRLRAVERVRGHGHLAHGVLLDSRARSRRTTRRRSLALRTMFCHGVNLPGSRRSAQFARRRARGATGARRASRRAGAAARPITHILQAVSRFVRPCATTRPVRSPAARPGG